MKQVTEFTSEDFELSEVKKHSKEEFLKLSNPVMKALLNYIHKEALKAAEASAIMHLKEYGDADLCGFAWVVSYEKGNTRTGKAIASLPGFRKSWNGGYDLWNPSGLGVQSVGILEKGAIAYVNTFKKYLPWVEMSSCSRLD